MDAALIEGIILLFERSALSELDYTEANGDRVRLCRHTRPGASAAAAPPIHRLPPQGMEAATSASSIVTASFQGVFHRGPTPGGPDFVAIGDLVAEGQVLGILEAMKVLNRIEAARTGRVLAIHAQSGDVVAAGVPLFTLGADGA